MSVCPEGKVFTRSAAITGATQAAAARFGHDRKLPSKPLGDAEGSSSVSTAEEMNEAQPQALDSSSRANTAKQRWVMRPRAFSWHERSVSNDAAHPDMLDY